MAAWAHASIVNGRGAGGLPPAPGGSTRSVRQPSACSPPSWLPQLASPWLNRLGHSTATGPLVGPASATWSVPTAVGTSRLRTGSRAVIP